MNNHTFSNSDSNKFENRISASQKLVTDVPDFNKGAQKNMKQKKEEGETHDDIEGDTSLNKL